MNDRERCAECGRFIKFAPGQFDVETQFGGPLDLEPPDAEFICRRCMIREAIYEAKVILAGRKPFLPWRPGYYHRLGWAIARGARKHGLTLEAVR